MTHAAGRTREIEQLERLLDDARAGRGRAALVLGEAGIGKTTLVEIVAESAAARGLCVATGRCVPSEMPAAWPWRQVVDTIDPSLRDVLDSEHDSPRPAVLALVTERLRAAIVGKPTLIVIEDAHWADRTTLALTTFVAAALRDVPLTLLVTARDEPDAGADALLDLNALSSSLTRLELTGIDAGAVRTIVGAIHGSDVDTELASLIHKRTGGNPFFVEEIARLWTMRGADARLEVPPGVAEVLRRRLARLPQPAATLLGAASLLGIPEPDLLAAMAGESEAEVLAQLGQAVAIGAVHERDEGFAFAHDLFRDTLAESLAPLTRARWHRRAAEALEALRPEEHARIASHWRSAGGPDAGRHAAGHARAAAAEAMQGFGYELAVRYYGWALDCDGEDTLRDRLELGEAQLLAGDLRAARETLRFAAQQALDREDGDLLARAVLAMGTGIGGFEVDIYDDEQRILLERALALLPNQDSSLRAAVSARLSLSRALVTPASARAADAEEAAAMASRVGDRAVEVSALAALCDALSGPDHVARRTALTDRMLMLARETGNPPLVLLARRLRVVVMLERGDFAAVDREIAEYDSLSERLHVPLLQWPVPVWRGMRALMRGDAAEATRWSDVAEAVARVARSPNAEMMVGTLRIAVERSRGHGCEPLDLLPPEMPGLLDWYAPAWCLLAACYAEAGRRREAQAFLDRVMERGPDGIDDDSERLEALWDLGDAAIVLEDRRAAAAALDALAPYEALWAIDGMGGACFGRVGDQVTRLRRFLERGRSAAAAPPAPLEADRGVLARRGDVWEVQWRGRSALVKDSKGLRDIAVLVSRPGAGVPVLELVAAAGGPATPERDLGVEVIDARARAEYRERIRELDGEVDAAGAAADPVRLASAKAERDVLMSELERALGLSGRPRRLGDRGERARTAVTTRIATAVKALEAALPELARHLQTSVVTGRVCTYAPDRPVEWTVS